MITLSPKERAVALDMARHDFYFYVRWKMLQRYGRLWMRGPHHARIAAALMDVYHGLVKRLLISMPPRYSKAVDCDTPMWTPTGWRRAGDLVARDKLLGSNGQWTTILRVHPQGVKPAFDVVFTDGSSLIACGDHQWSVRLRDQSKDRAWTAPWQVKTTDELRGDLQEADGRKKWRIPVLRDGNERDADLPIDPYVLGCWLGDGHSNGCAFTSMEPEIVAAFAPYDPKPYAHQSAGRATTYGLRAGFVTQIRALGLRNNKHIPLSYMLASHRQRLALLQGLADTDGWVGAANAQQGVCFSSRSLSDDVRSLVNSLGGVWRGFSSQPVRGREAHKTFLSMADGDCAFRLPRKVERINRRAERNLPRRFIANIEPVAAREMVCFTVDAADSLYCAGRDFIVTHNTQFVEDFISWTLGRHPDSEYMYLSYGSTLAADKSSEIRDDVTHPSYKELFPDIALAQNRDDHWKTVQGGVVYAAGAGATITGFGAGKMRDGFGGALIYDDPHKPDEVYSLTAREKVKRSFVDTAETRLNWPSTPIIVIMQGLHEEAIDQWLLAGGNGEKWTRLCLPAINEDGTALWPEKHSIETLLTMQKASPYKFSAQYMQRPTPLGGSFFTEDSLLVDGKPVPTPQLVDLVFAIIDSAMKTGKEHDGVAVTYFAKCTTGATVPLTVLDWDLKQIEGGLLAEWLPGVFARAEQLARETRARHGVTGVWIEDKNSGTVLLQQAQTAGLNAHPIDSKLSSMGKVERVVACERYVFGGEVKFSETAYNRVVTYKGATRNHLWSQIMRFSAAVVDQGEDDCLDTFAYGCTLGLGNPEGY